MPSSTLFLVIPCFNERDRLNPAVLLDFARPRPWLHYIFVDDGSRDGTPQLLAEVRDALPQQITLLTFPFNVGKAEAVRQGMLRACMQEGQYAGFWDADLSTPLDQVENFRNRLENNPGLDAVIGSRVKLLGRRIERRVLRHYLGRVFATAASLTLRLPVYDTQCGAKLFRVSPRLREVFATPFLARWIFDVEILARLDLFSSRIGRYSLADSVFEEVLPQWLDQSGSKRKFRDLFSALLDLLRIRRNYGKGIRQQRTLGGKGREPEVKVGLVSIEDSRPGQGGD